MIGCLHCTVAGFTPEFNILRHPEKLTFTAETGGTFSLDALGRLNQPPYNCEVLIESKGYSRGSGLIGPYREFVAKAYVTSRTMTRHAKDLFWFVTNVPFAADVGKKLTNGDWIQDMLLGKQRDGMSHILGAQAMDSGAIRDLADRIAVCILTDSFMKFTRVKYRVEQDDTVWDIVKLLHGGRVPTQYYGGYFQPLAHQVADENELPDPNAISPGQVLSIPWFGVD
jgi:hypothetical protein